MSVPWSLNLWLGVFHLTVYGKEYWRPCGQCKGWRAVVSAESLGLLELLAGNVGECYGVRYFKEPCC